MLIEIKPAVNLYLALMKINWTSSSEILLFSFPPIPHLQLVHIPHLQLVHCRIQVLFLFHKLTLLNEMRQISQLYHEYLRGYNLLIHLP